MLRAGDELVFVRAVGADGLRSKGRIRKEQPMSARSFTLTPESATEGHPTAAWLVGDPG
jgi:hypothetical protein